MNRILFKTASVIGALQIAICLGAVECGVAISCDSPGDSMGIMMNKDSKSDVNITVERPARDGGMSGKKYVCIINFSQFEKTDKKGGLLGGDGACGEMWFKRDGSSTWVESTACGGKVPQTDKGCPEQ